MSYLTPIRTKLKAILDAVKTAGDVEEVYDEEPKTLTNLPAAVLRFSGSSSEIHDTSSNMRTIEFTIRIYAKAMSLVNAENDIVDVTQDIITAIESDPTLTDTVLQTICRESPVIAEEREIPVFYADLLIECKLRVNR